MKSTVLKVMLISTLTAYGSLASAEKLTATSTLIPNAASTVAQQLPNKNFALPAELPAPLKNQQYTISVEAASNQYTINFDKTADCHGAKVCNAGSLTAINNANPQIYYDLNNKELTQTTHLKNKVAAFYTPAHAMADYWPALLEWRTGNTLYRLSWQGEINKSTLLKIANSLQNFPIRSSAS